MSLFAALPEDFLQFVWKTLHFDLRELQTTNGMPIQIIHPGRHNHDQGPDFLEASVRIGGVLWHGHVEIHTHSEDWYRHKHERDAQYNATILHVVREAGHRPVLREDGSSIPELVLKDRIPPEVLSRYAQLRLSEESIPCGNLLDSVPELHRHQWITRMTIERMEEKAAQFQQDFLGQEADWEEALWQGLAAYIGGPVNQDAFRTMAERVPYRILRQNHDRLERLEALLFGGIGSLGSTSPQDTYIASMKAEWTFLQQKYAKLASQPIPLKYGRMRPASFPTIRLSQLAQILHQFFPLIDLLEESSFHAFLEASISVSEYWETHYHFFEISPKRKKQLGTSQKEVLISNVLIPAAFLYQRAHGRENIYELIESGLQALSAENNRLTRPMEALGFRNANAFDSQGLIQLNKQYCKQKRCLSCHIGQRILRG